jgi:protein SCO1/2
MSETTAEKSPASQKLIFLLLAVASLSTTALIVLTIFYQRLTPAGPGGPQAGGMYFHAERPTTEPPEVLFNAPAFSLTQRDDSTVSLDDLKGKVWVGNFIFTRCAGICPMMTASMASLQQDLRLLDNWDDIRLVSFSVDPGHDTPEVLREYAEQYKADKTHWLFLTGERQTVWRMVADGFKLAVGEVDDNPAMPILHSEKFVLVDQAGHIRGYYDGTEDEQRGALVRDLQLLLREGAATATPQAGK